MFEERTILAVTDNEAEAYDAYQKRIAERDRASDEYAAALIGDPVKFERKHRAEALGLTETELADAARRDAVLDLVSANPDSARKLLAEHYVGMREQTRRQSITGKPEPPTAGMLDEVTVHDVTEALEAYEARQRQPSVAQRLASRPRYVGRSG